VYCKLRVLMVVGLIALAMLGLLQDVENHVDDLHCDHFDVAADYLADAESARHDSIQVLLLICNAGIKPLPSREKRRSAAVWVWRSV